MSAPTDRAHTRTILPPPALFLFGDFEAQFDAERVAIGIADGRDLGLLKRRNDLRDEMVTAFLNATDHPREMRLLIPKLRIADKMGGKVREDLINLILKASPANLRGGR